MKKRQNLRDKYFGDKEACDFWENIFSMAAAATLVMVFLGSGGTWSRVGAIIYTLIFTWLGWAANRKGNGGK